jgi:tetratricopeptide (TPR) repeat protein
MSRYFERFREALAGYAEGVHRLGEPASEQAIARAAEELGRAVPEVHLDFLRSWDGVELFHEELVIHGTSILVERNRGEAERAPADLLIAQSSAGDRYFIEGETGRVIEHEGETGLAWAVGSSFARWLDAAMARGGAVYDREGEFREGVFAGDELAPEVALKLARRLTRIDPEASKAHYELGKALAEAGQTRPALRALEQAAALDEAAVWAWFDLGRLRLDDGDAAGAEAAFAHASAGDPEYEHTGYFAAWAARAALAAGDAAAAERHRAHALALDPAIVARQIAAAEHELEAGRRDRARELCELALAVAPRDMKALDLRTRINRKK